MSEKGKPTKPKRTLSKEQQDVTTTNIKRLLKERGLIRFDLSKKTGINNATIYKSLKGERLWTYDHLELIAQALKVSIGELTDEPRKPLIVPMVGGIKQGHGPPQEKIEIGDSQEVRPMELGEDLKNIAQMYCMEVEDESLMPIFPPGVTLFAQRETSDTIHNGNYVVYWEEDGGTSIRQIFINNDHFILRSLTQGTPDKVLPKKHLRVCDKILNVKFPA